MKLEQQVCSLELAKRLKELGVKQESHFVWIDFCDGFEVKEKLPAMPKPSEGMPWFSAFSVAELGEMLPTNIDTSGIVNILTINHWSDDDKWQVSYLGGQYNDDSPFGDFIVDEKTEADARAKMLIYLLENRLIKPLDGGKEA